MDQAEITKTKDQKHGGGLKAALDMPDIFASVGIRFFDLTHTNIDGEKRGFRRKQSLQQVRTSMPYLLDSPPRVRTTSLFARTMPGLA